MDGAMIGVAERCLAGAESDSMNFPQIVAALAGAGFEGYAIDFRRRRSTYYGDGEGMDLVIHPLGVPVAAAFAVEALRAAIGEAQGQVPGYSYRGFCDKAAAAGCAGYLVSFSGRRVVYYGRTGETHVEHFPS